MQFDCTSLVFLLFVIELCHALLKRTIEDKLHIPDFRKMV